MMMTCEAQMASNNFVIRKSVFHADEDGKHGAQVIDVTFNSETLLFSATLPDHVASYNGTVIDKEITGDTAQGVIETYEIRCDEYSRWRLSVNAPQQLWIEIYSMAGDFARQMFDFTYCCGIGATAVKMLPDGQMVRVLDDGSFGGPVGSKGGTFQPVLIDDTPEHRAKVQTLAASIQRAADILTGLRTAANPGEYLMAIREDWQQQAPVQGELPIEPIVGEDDEL
jgi:hypothetical protein